MPFKFRKLRLTIFLILLPYRLATRNYRAILKSGKRVFR